MMRMTLCATAIGMAMLVGCKREAPEADAAADQHRQAEAQVADAHAQPHDPAVARIEHGPEGGMEMPGTPAQYRRAVDVQVKGAAFSTSGDDVEDTLGPPATNFSANDSVYIELSTQGTDGDYMITTRWIDPAGETLLENGRTVADAGPERTIFSLSKPDGWVAGTYRIQVEINGKQAGEYPFTVK